MVCANVCRYATRAAMLIPDGVREFEALVALIRMCASKRIVRHGYLEFALPTIDVAVRDALHAGAHPIVIVPGVLFAAAHAKNDLPTELHWLQHTFPEAKFSFASALDLHPRLLQLCAQRIIEA